jgi:hypothetical protein
MKDELTAVRLLAFATGIIAGTLAAFAAQICLTHLHIELATAWRDLFVTWKAQTKSAFAWWTMALVALVVGYIAAAMTQFMMLHWWPLRLLRWVAGATIVAALTVIGHDAGAAGSPDAGAQVGASLLGAIFAMSTASIGAGFSTRN